MIVSDIELRTRRAEEEEAHLITSRSRQFFSCCNAFAVTAQSREYIRLCLRMFEYVHFEHVLPDMEVTRGNITSLYLCSRRWVSVIFVIFNDIRERYKRLIQNSLILEVFEGDSKSQNSVQ